MIPREVARELSYKVLNRRASAGTKTAEERRAMEDADMAYELGDMPITDSCDVVRYVSVSYLSLLKIVYHPWTCLLDASSKLGHR
jgi:hypothetical protein